MTKENILFGIVGLLGGVIIGFVFANSVNQRGYATRPVQTVSAASGSDLPSDHPSLPSNAVADQSKMPPEILAKLQKAKSEPNNFDAQMEAAQLYYQIQRYPEALNYLQRANQIKPDNYDAVVALGNTNFDANNYEAAEKWYNTALAKKPADVSVRTDLGLTFLFRTPPDYDRAIKEFRRSLELDPKHEQTLQNITVALSKKGSYDEAQQMLKRLEEVNPQNPSIAKLRSDLDQSGSKPKA